MSIIRRLIFVVFIIPLGVLYIVIDLLSIIFYIPYWIITGESLTDVSYNFGNWIWERKIALNG